MGQPEEDPAIACLKALLCSDSRMEIEYGEEVHKPSKALCSYTGNMKGKLHSFLTLTLYTGIAQVPRSGSLCSREKKTQYPLLVYHKSFTEFCEKIS
jgi:hypothetical protein